MTDLKIFNGNKTQLLEDYDIDLNFSIDCTTVEQSVRDLLTAVGEDPQRDGLLNTPSRVARMYEELLSGYTTDPEKVITSGVWSFSLSSISARTAPTGWNSAGTAVLQVVRPTWQ